jgi:transposase
MSTILTIDLGKYKSVACVYDPGTGEYRVTTVDTTRAELSRLLVERRPGVVVIEACLLAGWVYDLVRSVD